MPGRLTPRLHEGLVRLGTWIPSFAKAAAELAWFTGAQVHPDTARRLTEAAGAAAVAGAEAAPAQTPGAPPPEGPAGLVVSVDGAMVPLVHGQWGEARTLAVGAVQPPVATPDGPVIRTADLSYFSRLTDSTTFAELAWPELQRRGIRTAGRVGAVVDGAEWCQTFLDWNCPRAVRILDFAHAAEYLTAIGQVAGPLGPLLSETEGQRLRHALKHEGPDPVLRELRTLAAAHPTLAELAGPLAYLEKRIEQMQYPRFLEDGWPIGSGMVESANKLVVEDRLKGAGMHWASQNVNPLLALRNSVCNDRWAEDWSRLAAQQRRQRAERRRARRRVPAPGHSAPPPLAPSDAPVPPPCPSAASAPRAKASPRHRPAANHPWRKAWSRRCQQTRARARSA